MSQASRINKGLGWKPELPDKRDFRYSARRIDQVDAALTIKPKASSTGFRKAAFTDQRMTSACVGHSTARHWQQERRLTPRSPIDPYWRARQYRNWQNEDEGAYIRDAFKMLAAQGCTRDDLYRDIDSNIFTPPSARANNDADDRVPVSYYRIDSDDDGDRQQVRARILACIASGHSFVTGVTCYDSFFSDRTVFTGLVSMPNLEIERDNGGHAMHFGEYDLNFRESEQAQKLRNNGIPERDIPEEVAVAAQSWGSQFAQLWYFPLQYIVDRYLSDDAWTSRRK